MVISTILGSVGSLKIGSYFLKKIHLSQEYFVDIQLIPGTKSAYIR